MRRILALSTLLALFVAVPSCKKPSEPPLEIQEKYRPEATAFCQVIVGCMQEDMRARLADEPQRRDLVIRRMNEEVCHHNQIEQLNQLHLLGELEADPAGPQRVAYDAELYRAYGSCTAALKQAREEGDCATVRSTYDSNPDCKIVRPSKKQAGVHTSARTESRTAVQEG